MRSSTPANRDRAPSRRKSFGFLSAAASDLICIVPLELPLGLTRPAAPLWRRIGPTQAGRGPTQVEVFTTFRGEPGGSPQSERLQSIGCVLR